jgi:hypothetical protein
LRLDISVGFIIGGHVASNRHPVAFELQFNPDQTSPVSSVECPRGTALFGGIPNLTHRIINGIAQEVFEAILASPHWSGDRTALDSLVRPHLYHPRIMLPMREAVDWIYSMIFTTIKGLKFSHVPPLCGGPIEIALITADRRFRWVCHKGLDQALTDHSARGTY